MKQQIDNKQGNVISELDELTKKFNEAQNKNDMSDVIKELFDPNKIQMITDLTSDEIRLLTRIYTISQIKDIKIYDKSLDIFTKLLLSKNRKSRSELLDAIRGYMGSMGLMQRINPFNWGKNR